MFNVDVSGSCCASCGSGIAVRWCPAAVLFAHAESISRKSPSTRGIMRCHVATTAFLAILLFASSKQVEAASLDGITGLQVLPFTGKGQLFGACFNEMLKNYGSSEQTLYDIRVNKTVAPVDVRLDGQFAEQVATQLTDAQVDEFCAAATNPTMARAVQAMEQTRGAAGAKARIEWQASVRNSANQQPISPASNMRTAGSGAKTAPHPAIAQKPVTVGNSSSAAAKHTELAAATGKSRSAPAKRAGSTPLARSRPAAAKPKGVARPAAGFETPYTTDPVSGLFLPHEAEYSPVEGGYATLMAPLVAAGLFPNGNGDTRSDSAKVATAVITCEALEVTQFVVTVVCGLTGTTGAWTGACALAAAGLWTAPAEIVCLAAQAATGTAFALCNDVVTGSDFVDGNVDAGEIQAAYENGKKALDNHVILWNKADSDTTSINNQVQASETAVISQLQATEAAVLAQVQATEAAVLAQVQATEAAVLAQVQATERAVLTQVKATEAALTTRISEAQTTIIANTEATVAAAVATLSGLMRDLFTVSNSQVCDLKTDVAQVQREADYLRRLLLTPEYMRPGYNCPLLTASTTPKNKCDVRCPMAPPNACLAVDITHVVPARLTAPMPFCQ